MLMSLYSQGHIHACVRVEVVMVQLSVWVQKLFQPSSQHFKPDFIQFYTPESGCSTKPSDYDISL